MRSLLTSNEPDSVTEPWSASEDTGESGCQISTGISQTFTSIQDSATDSATDQVVNENQSAQKLAFIYFWKWNGLYQMTAAIEQLIFMEADSQTSCETVPQGKPSQAIIEISSQYVDWRNICKFPLRVINTKIVNTLCIFEEYILYLYFN